jgi:hypothetical protein
LAQTDNNYNDSDSPTRRAHANVLGHRLTVSSVGANSAGDITSLFLDNASKDHFSYYSSQENKVLNYTGYENYGNYNGFCVNYEKKRFEADHGSKACGTED